MTTLALASPRVLGLRPQLADVVLGSNANNSSQWAQRTDGTADIAAVDFYEFGQRDGGRSLANPLDTGRVLVGLIEGGLAAAPPGHRPRRRARLT